MQLFPFFSDCEGTTQIRNELIGTWQNCTKMEYVDAK